MAGTKGKCYRLAFVTLSLCFRFYRIHSHIQQFVQFVTHSYKPNLRSHRKRKDFFLFHSHCQCDKLPLNPQIKFALLLFTLSLPMWPLFYQGDCEVLHFTIVFRIDCEILFIFPFVLLSFCSRYYHYAFVIIVMLS